MMSCSILAAQSKPVEMEDGIMVIDSQSPPNSTASDKFFPDALISYYQHDDASWIGNPEKSLLLKKLRRASTVCESMDNVRGKDELKILLAESIILYREYQLGDSCDQGRYAAVYPSSPTSSMFPQLGLLEKISIIIPQLDCRHRVMELSLLTPTSNNSEKRRRKVGCLGLKRMSFKPLRRLGGNLSRMLQRIRRFGSFGLYSRGRGLTPNREPISPCLSRRHSQHESPSPAILFDGDLNEESCRSSDVVYGSSVPNHSRSDPLNFGSLRIRRNTDDMDSNQKEDMQQNKMKQVQAKSFTETKLQSQMSLMRTPSAAKTILLLETATAIGLSLCKAFLVWKHAASSYWHEQALLSPEYSQVSMASASKTIVAPLDFERKLTEGSNNFAKAATLGLTISVGPSLMAVDSGITERHGSNDSCDSYYSSGYDSCSCSDDENAGSPTCNGDEAECGDHRKDGGKYFQLDDSSAVGDVTDACRASDRVILVARNAAALKSTCKQEMTHRRQKQCKAGDSHHAESGIRRRRRHSRHNRVAPKENQETVLQSSNWLACLNDVDVTDCADAKDHDEDNTSGPTGQFEYEEVYGSKDVNGLNDNPQNRRKNGVSKRISSPIVASESDSEPDSDLNSCSTTNTHCLRTSPTSFIESNPISKLVQADKHGRSVSFDGGCLPLPLLFDRRKRSLSSALLPRPLPMTPLEGPLSKPSQRLKLPLPPSALSCPKLSPNSQPESKSVPSFSNVFDYDGYSGFINETRSSTSGSKVARLVPKTNSVGFPGGADYKDCFGAPREPLMLQSHIPGRNEQYESIGPVIRSNELALWAIFAQYPIACDSSYDQGASALTVHNYCATKPILSFAALRSLLSAFGVCPAICSETELLEHLKEMKVAVSPPSSPFFMASPIKVCSFDSFVKILWLVASTRMLISVNAIANQPSDVQAQVRFAMLLHQMDISEGRSKLTQCLMNSSNLGSRRYDNGECLSPQSPVSQTYMEPLLPLPPFDLSILKVARAGTALRKMVMNESAIKTKGKKKVSGKSGGQTKMQRQGQDLVPGQRQEQGQQQDHRRERKLSEPSLWSKFAREVTSGIATENSSEDLSDF